MRIGVVGATGAVGREMWRLLEASDLPVHGVVPYTSPRSAGQRLTFRGVEAECRALNGDSIEALDLVLASAGASVTREWAPRLAARGAVVVDNSSAFRQDPDCPLVVPEVNGHALGPGATIIANPNCSTIQMVAALAPLHRAWGLCGVRVATYQSVSGAGARAVDELTRDSRAVLGGNEPSPEVFPHPIAFNALPQIGDFDETGESVEERKMRLETRRILELPELPVSATCVRVPVYRGHSEAVWAVFREEPEPERARALLREAGIVVIDDPAGGSYPLATTSAGRPEVFAGRIRRDPADPRGLCLWVVSDNLLKGAALNALQIAELLAARGWIPRRAA